MVKNSYMRRSIKLHKDQSTEDDSRGLATRHEGCSYKPLTNSELVQ